MEYAKIVDIGGKLNPDRTKTTAKAFKHGFSGFILWSYWPESNRRPADYESAALPTEPQ